MDTQAKLEELIKSNEVILFMKGTRAQPECGFSATVVSILDDYLESYATVNVLADPAVRQGIKELSKWPTIPQLYVKGEFVGGCDIVKEMRGSGDLESTLGTGPLPVQTPDITVADAAIEAFRGHTDGEKPVIRLAISGGYDHELYFDDPQDSDLVLDDNRFTLLIDKASARRADGLVIDFVTDAGQPGFKIDNPNAPPKVKPLSPAQLKTWLDEGKAIELFDVRSNEEREIAKIEGARQLDEAGKEVLAKLDKDTVLVFHCHHGGRSFQAATHCLRMGFAEVYNLVGGIDAWAQNVDTGLKRY